MSSAPRGARRPLYCQHPPIPTRTAPACAPRTSWGSGSCRRTRRQQHGLWAARAPTRVARMGTVRAEAAVSRLEANRRQTSAALRVCGRQCDGDPGAVAASARTGSHRQVARERVERRQIAAHLRPDSATRERMQRARGASDARAARRRLSWRVGRCRRCTHTHTLLTCPPR
eukprot:2157016-Prymnesium_polylepis.2